MADYLVNTQNPLSRTFTVVFQSKQANSSEHVIQIADDNIFEGSEAFRLRIVNVRFIGQAGAHFRTEDGVNSTVVDVTIADNDCELGESCCTTCCTLINSKRTYNIICACNNTSMHCLPQLLMSIGQCHEPLT